MQKSKGSILLEVAIAVSIIGIISGGVISYFSTFNKIKAEKITQENIETVAIALASFVAQNYRLPKPSNNLNGEECDETGCYVPYKTIGISSKTAKDGHGNPLIYAVEPMLTSKFDCIHENDISAYGFCRKITSPTIVINQTNETQIAFVLDVKNGGISFQKSHINVTPKEHTLWLSKNMLLMKYLKTRPCEEDVSNNFQNKTTPTITQSNDDEFEF